MHLTIDFSPNRQRISARSLALLAASVFALGLTIWICFSEFEALRDAKNRLQAVHLKAERSRVVLTPVKAEAINRAIRQMNLPWDSLFSEIEMKLTDRVSLLSLEPEASTRLLRIQGEAKSAEDMLDFVSSLDDQKFFHRATLIRHEINESDRNRPIRFVAEVLWQPE